MTNIQKTIKIDNAEILRTLRLLHPPGEVFEIRALKSRLKGERRAGTISGFFSDAGKAVAELSRLESWDGIYVTLNPVIPALLARRCNRLACADTGELTTDRDIVRRRWLPMDIDAVRPAKISATDAEKAAAMELADRIDDYLGQNDWPEPIKGDSANGAHRLYSIDMPVNDGGLVERTLKALAEMFVTEVAHVDTAVHNPARIWKLYGCLACKGDNVPDRPHRMARIISAPPAPTEILCDQLEHIAAQATPKPAPAKAATASAAGNSTFNLADWLRRHEPAAKGPESWNGGSRWKIPVCPFNPAHVGSAAVFQHASGAADFKCFHNSCQSNRWAEYRELRDPGHRDRKPLAQISAQPTADEPGETVENYGLDDIPAAAPKADTLPALVIEDAAEIIRTNPDLRPHVIDGLLREREIMNFISASKAGKTFAMFDLALCIATGRAWLQRFAVQRGDVLYIDAELHRQTIGKRLSAIAAARGITSPEFAGKLNYMSLRGRLRTIAELDPTIRQIPPETYKAIFLDSLYRLWPAGMDENNNADVTAVYNRLDQWAEVTGAAIVCVHHASKGNQSSKSVADVGSGAGAQSRAADTHLVLRAHEQEDAAVVEAVARSWPPLAPFCIRWAYPAWFIDDSLDAGHLREPGKRGAAAKTMTAASFVDGVLNGRSLSRNIILAKASKLGISRREGERLFDLANADGLIEPRQDEKDKRRTVYGRPENL